MPVLGHAFVGWAAALTATPERPSSGVPVDDRSTSRGRAFLREAWAPLLIGLSYLPDIVSQISLALGWPGGRIMAHSVAFAAVAAVLLAWTLVRVPGVPFVRTAIIAGTVIGLHDLLDVIQSTDRLPFWPLRTGPVGWGLGLLPSGSVQEGIWFSAAFLLFLGIRRYVLARRRRISGGPVEAESARPRAQVPSEAAPQTAERAVPDASLGADGHSFGWPRCAGQDTFEAGSQNLPHSSRSRPKKVSRHWPAAVAVAGLLTAALVTHAMRDAREDQLRLARSRIQAQDYTGALSAVALAARWPSAARPGRVEQVRAEAYLGLGQRDLAEQELRKACAADPSYFWSLADLAVLLASTDKPVDERRRLVEPYVRRLRTEFAREPSLAETLDRIDRRLRRDGRSGGRTERPARRPAPNPPP